MSGPDVGAPVFCCRRLLRQDLFRLCGLYQKSLAANAAPDCSLVQSWFARGLCFGAFCGGALVGAMTLLPFRCRLSPAAELRATHCVRLTYSDDSWLCCGFAVLPGMPTALLGQALWRFCTAVLERSGPAPDVAAVLAVKTATPALGAFLEGGLQLCAIRPLRNLTPCYLLEPGRDDGNQQTLTLSLENTLTIAHALEDGWRGRGVRKNNLLLWR